MSGLPSCEHLLLQREGAVLTVLLNRPQVRNALNARMWDEIDGVFAAIEADRSVKVIVLRGAGGTFCAGGDIRERSALRDAPTGAEGDAVARRNRRAGHIFARIDRAPQVVVAAVEGHALGGGFGMACAADITLATRDVRFGLPEVTLGLAPAQILPFLLRRIGAAQMRRVTLTAEQVDAAQALRLGIVHEVCEDAAALQARLASLLASIDRGAPGALAAAKQLIARAEVMPQEELLDYASGVLAGLSRSAEGIEGAAAFQERRPPRWPAAAH